MKTSTCGRCGFPIIKSTALKSRHTQSIYCPDVGDCDRRYRNDLSLEEIEIKVRMLGDMLER